MMGGKELHSKNQQDRARVKECRFFQLSRYWRRRIAFKRAKYIIHQSPIHILIQHLHTRSHSTEQFIPHSSLFSVIERLAPSVPVMKIMIFTNEIHTERTEDGTGDRLLLVETDTRVAEHFCIEHIHRGNPQSEEIDGK